MAAEDAVGRDGYARTPLHVAAYGGHHEAMRALVAAGANPSSSVPARVDPVREGSASL